MAQRAQTLGSILSDAAITIDGRTLTQQGDSVTLNQSATDLSFGRLDKFSFTVDPNVTSCLVFSYPANTQIRIGSDAFPVTTNTLDLNTLDLNTLGACDKDSTELGVRGKPDLDPETDSGVFVWQEEDDTWVVRVLGGGLPSALIANGGTTSNVAFTSVTEQSIEASDVFDTQSPNAIMFGLKVRGPWRDGFEFTVPTGADLCVALDDPAIELFIGPRKTWVAAPFNLSALGACQESFVDGSPMISPTSDEGVFVWREDGVWHVKATTFTSDYFIQGRVQSYNGPLIDWSTVSLEDNPRPDFLTLQAPNRFLFRMVTVDGDEDEITFVIPDGGESCLNIKIPQPVSTVSRCRCR